jgi:hypothetical protein
MLDALALAYLLRESLQERSTAGSAPLSSTILPPETRWMSIPLVSRS